MYNVGSGIAELQALAFEASPMPCAVVDQDGLIVVANAAARAAAGGTEQGALGHAVGRSYGEFCAAELRGCGELLQGLAAVLHNERESHVGEYRCRGARERWLQITAGRLRARSFHGAIVVHLDVTERRRAEDRALHRALHDPLTGLPNRSLFEDRLDRAIAKVKRYVRPIAVALVDLNDFKEVNDTLGHLAGDQVLTKVAARAGRVVRGSDTLARLGGDEFALILHDAERPGAAREAAAKMVREISAPLTIGDREISVTSSVGIALCPAHGLDPEQLLASADTALYEAKARGSNAVVVYRTAEEAGLPATRSRIGVA